MADSRRFDSMSANYQMQAQPTLLKQKPDPAPDPPHTRNNSIIACRKETMLQETW